MSDKVVRLSNGLKVPVICYGPGMMQYNMLGWENIRKLKIEWNNKYFQMLKKDYKKERTIQKIILDEEGPIFIDTASAYGVAEKVIGTCMNGIEREKIILCTKLSAKDQIRNGRNIKKVYENSMKTMGIKRADIYFMHWPWEKNYIDVWKQMEELYLQGKVRAIGVCNCHIHHLENILSKAEVKPMIHQMEVHPLFTQTKEREFCKKEGIQVMAYTPLARNDDRLFNNRTLNKIGHKKHKSVAQIILRWHLQLGNIPVVSTSDLEHYRENMDIFDFELSEEEVDSISRLNINSRLRYDSDNCDYYEL